MNQTHIHLLITHLPIFGSILGAIVLAQGIWTKTEQTKVAAYYLFILAAIGAGIAYLPARRLRKQWKTYKAYWKHRLRNTKNLHCLP